MARKRRDPPRLVVHGVSAATWTRRYGVVPFTTPCSHCGRPLTTSLPFVEGNLRGLVAPPCECGVTGHPGTNHGSPYAMLVGGEHGLSWTR